MRKVGWLAGTLAVVGLTLGSPAQAGDPQVRFRVKEPFRVGSHAYDAGVISLRTISAFTPSRPILEVWVNNECLGLMTMHRSTSDALRGTEALFLRGGDGRLEMSGFSVTSGAIGSTYRFPRTLSAPPSSESIALAFGSN